MADYFTHFSRLLDTGSTGNVAKALDLYRDYADELDREDLTVGFAAEGGADAEATKIWIHDDGEGDVEHVSACPQRCGQALGLSGRWASSTPIPARARASTASGGAHVLDLATGQTVGWTNTDGWLAVAIAGDSAD